MASITNSGAYPGPRAIEITIHRCINTPADLAFGLIEKKRDYYVEVTLGNQKKRTENRRRKSHQLEWNEKLVFNSADALSATLSLYCHRTLRARKLVKQLVFSFQEVDCDITRSSITRTASFSNGPHIEFNIRDVTLATPVPTKDAVCLPRVTQLSFQPAGQVEHPATQSAIEESRCDIREEIGPLDMADKTERQVSKSNDETNVAIEQAQEALKSQHTPKDSWRGLLEGIESFREITVHPYAQIAHTILFAIPGPLIKQLERDEDIRALFDSFICFRDIVNELKNSGLAREGKLMDVLKRVSLQMTEVAYFVSDYCKNKSFLVKALKHKVSGVNDIIQDYRAKLEELKEEFRIRLGLETGKIAGRTELKIVRVLQEVAILGQSLDLNDIPYVPGAGLRTDKKCLVGTRETFLERIEDFISSGDSRAMWIAGGAGTGKSSIAHTIAGRFRELGRLGSIFCFSEDKEATCDPASLFPNIARDLADLDPNIRAELAKAAQNKADRTTSDIWTQFDKLILIPANAIRENMYGPIVIVIDALDEAKATAREVLLKVLATRLKELPPNIRIIITSRPDRDIEDALGNESDTSIHRMHAIPLESTIIDIAMYVKSRLADRPGIDNKKCQELALHAHGLFQWARVACDYIRTAGSGETPLSRYEELIPLEGSVLNPLLNHNKKPIAQLPDNNDDELIGDQLLDTLYRAVLSKFVSANKKAVMEKFKFVMARVLAAREPLSSKSLNKLVSASRLAPKGCNVQNVVADLGSLLGGVEDEDTPIRPLHTSFRNFLTSKERSKTFFIDSSIAAIDSDMALSSMRIMNNELKFNICGLLTSHLRNKDVPGIEESIKEHIPPHLSYSCRFWAAHICSLPALNPGQPGVHVPTVVNPWGELTKGVEKLLSTALPYWLEVLSVCCEFDPGVVQIRKLSMWLKTCNADKDLILLIDDIEHFCSYFAKCITSSAPHIYVSALPFAPKESLVFKTYIKSYDRTLAVVCGQLQQYPSCLNVLDGHRHGVTSVAFSPDGARIVSSSKDFTIRVWNTENGEMVLGPLEGHTYSVTSVSFSSDGTHIISGSEDFTIRVWNGANGEMVTGPLKGHTNYVTSVSFSPDGTRIVSGSRDTTVQVWNTENGTVAIKPLQGHTHWVNSVAFSPDGTRIVSGSADETVRVWNAENGEMVVGPLQGHMHWVTSVSFSPDGIHIVSGSQDKTIRMWNAESGEMAIKPLKGHTREVTSVAFSPDGTRVVSGSQDKTIRVWNVESGEMDIVPLEGHMNYVTSVAFSPDGTRIISGSSDKTIRVWNVENGETDIGSLEGHTDYVTSAAFSPDGTRIVSGSSDHTIQVWNAENGRMVIGPLKGHTYHVTSVALSRDGTRIVSSSKDFTIRVWNTGNGEMAIGPFKGHTDCVTSVAFSPDGTRIVSGSQDKTIRVWNTENGEVTLGPLKGHTREVTSVTFSPDGTRILSSSGDHSIRLWHAENGEMVIGPLHGHTRPVASIAFSPDGTRIVSGSWDCTIRIWNARNGDMVIRPLRGHKNYVTSVAFSHDGTRIVSGSRDRTIRVWNATSGELVIGPLRGHTYHVTSVAFSPDGTRIVSGSRDKSVQVRSIQDYVENDLNLNTELKGLIRAPEIVPRYHWRVEDGWSLGDNGELLFYVPPVHRKLYQPNTTLVISTEHHTKLDMSRFKHGIHWTECWSGSTSDISH